MVQVKEDISLEQKGVKIGNLGQGKKFSNEYRQFLIAVGTVWFQDFSVLQISREINFG